MITCSRCNAANPNAAKFCGKCGQRIQTIQLPAENISVIRCMQCGTSNPEIARYCLSCGQQIISSSSWNLSDPWHALDPVNQYSFLPSSRYLPTGTTIGSYMVIKRLGVGGIGAVYLASHQLVKQLVAIKLHDYFPTDKYLGVAFRRAANYLSQLDHPNIVHLYNYGLQNGSAYLAMEFVNGPTFAELIPNQQTQGWLENCLDYFGQLLSALQYAHNCRYNDIDGTVKQGIFHGDIKPQNIILDRNANAAKLADFMIPDVQAFLGEKEHDFRGIEYSTQPYGTLTYMAPEQERGQLTQQTDIFSLGATMYQLVTGYTPVRQKIWEGAHPQRINPYVPAWLDSMIVTAVEGDPNKRFQTVAEMVRIFNKNRKPEKPGWFFNVKEWVMRDQVNIETGDISNSGQLYLGKFNSVVSNLNASGKNEFADALQTLKDAVMASQHLPPDKKEEQVEIINQIGEEAAKSKPNKTLLKMLGDSLLAALKLIPDVANAVIAVAPVFTKLGI